MDTTQQPIRRPAEETEPPSALSPQETPVIRPVMEREKSADEIGLRAMAAKYGLEYVDLEGHQVDRDLLSCFPSRELFQHAILPLKRHKRGAGVATSDPCNWEALDELSAASGLALEPVLASREQIERHLKVELGVGGGTVREMVARDGEVIVEEDHSDADTDLDDASQASSVIKLVNELLREAVMQRASDIHLEPSATGLEIRYRVDGMLHVQSLPPELHWYRAAIVSRLKILAKLNIAEKRLPQDGRIRLSIDGREVDVRVSIIPMLHSEGVVMRLLDKSKSNFNLESVHFPAALSAIWQKLIRRPHGMLLVTGPTGSGKTTTLYSSLADIRSPFTKIITIEDPVEYDLQGISQIQVNSKIGLSFAAGLRSVLRHDPDVVLIGEIRDAETATSAIQASLTGHLVLSTLHTNDACSAATRLIDMGVEPFLVTSTLSAAMAQRLVRKICPDCKEEYEADPKALPADFMYRPGEKLYRGRGCR